MSVFTNTHTYRNALRGTFVAAVLASAFAFMAGAQSQNQTPDTVSTGISQQTPPPAQQPDINQQRLSNSDHEGFWGHMQPFARKKWIKKRLDPINDRLNELDELNAKNANDIKDVDARATAGIRNAQNTADQANQTATAANTQAQTASTTAQGASAHVDTLNTTVNGLDQYKAVSETEVRFRSGAPVLSADAKSKLDDLIQSTNGKQGYIIDIEAHSPARGAAGIQSSQKYAQVINRYLVEHNIPVYRLHAVAMGNATSSDSDERVRYSVAKVRLMENSLAARNAPSPQGGGF